jgi:hypothetical protein
MMESNIRRQLGQHEEALGLLDRLDGTQFDDDGFEYDASMFALQRAESLSALGRPGEAADALLEGLTTSGILDSHLGTLAEHLERAGRPLDEIALALPAEQLRPFLAQVLQLREDVADRILEACVDRRPDDALPILATAATLAKRLGVERALCWSARLRERGLDDSCPLLTIVAEPRRSPPERARAAAAGYRVFGDARLAAAFADVLQCASPAERDAIADETAVLCPELLDEAGASLSGGAPH